MKTWIISIIIGLEAAAIVVLSFCLSFSLQTNEELKVRCNEQSTVIERQATTIDSLLNRRDKFIDLQLHVTDKSKATIYGRYNKGTIIIPQEKIYRLELDSTTLNIK